MVNWIIVPLKVELLIGFVMTLITFERPNHFVFLRTWDLDNLKLEGMFVDQWKELNIKLVAIQIDNLFLHSFLVNITTKCNIKNVWIKSLETNFFSSFHILKFPSVLYFLQLSLHLSLVLQPGRNFVQKICH